MTALAIIAFAWAALAAGFAWATGDSPRRWFVQ